MILPWLNHADCPDRDRHRPPQGPCEDLGQCPRCLWLSFEMRPAGETFGFHARDCSLSERHEGDCVGGGNGHRPGVIRGYWGPTTDDDIAAERAWWAAKEAQ